MKHLINNILKYTPIMCAIILNIIIIMLDYKDEPAVGKGYFIDIYYDFGIVFVIITILPLILILINKIINIKTIAYKEVISLSILIQIIILIKIYISKQY